MFVTIECGYVTTTELLIMGIYPKDLFILIIVS